MKVVYLGTGAAEGIPALFCNCSYCTAARKAGGKYIRTRSQTLFDGELCIDFPPDSFYHTFALGADLSAVRYLLVTHSHIDHFAPADLVLRGYKYAHNIASPDLDIYGNAEVAEVYGEATRREIKADVAAHISVHTVEAYRPFSFGKWRACALNAQHSSRDPFVYYLEKGGKRVLHLCDTGALVPSALAWLSSNVAPLHLVTLDSTFLFGKTEPHARHMGLDENLRVRDALAGKGLVNGDTKFVITHFSHNSAPTFETLAAVEARYGVIAAYDGMTLEI